MKKTLLFISLILVTGLVFSQNRQEGQNFLQGTWEVVDSSFESGMNFRRLHFFGDKGTWVPSDLDRDFVGDMPFTYENNLLTMNFSYGGVFWRNLLCLRVGDDQIFLLFGNGWVELIKTDKQWWE